MKYLLTLFLFTAQLFGAGFSSSLAFRGQFNGNSLLNGIGAFFPMDEQATGTAGTNRAASFPVGMTWLDKFQDIYTVRGVSGGAGGFQDNSSSLHGLYVTNSVFDAGAGRSFTCAFWCMGGGNNGIIGEWDAAAGNAWDYYCTPISFTTTTANFIDTSGTPVSVNSTNFSNNNGVDASYQWEFIAYGYDASTHKVFISVNASPMTTTSTGGNDIRATGGRGFVYLPRLTLADNVGFWNRALTQQELTNLYNGGFSDQYPFGFTAGNNCANAYGWVVTNQSGTISSNTWFAAKTLVDGLYTDGVLDKFVALLPMANDSLPAALDTLVCPVYFQGIGRGIEPAVDPYTIRHNFVSGDVSINGVTGNGVNKWTQLSASVGAQDLVTNICESGFVVYCYTATASATGVEFAAQDGFAPGSGIFGVVFHVNNSGSFNSQNHLTQGTLGYHNSIVYGGSQLPGYYSVQRDAQNSLSMYFANSGNAHSLLMSTNANMVSCSWSRTGVFPLFAYYDGNICGGCNFSVNTLSSFGLLWKHLSSSQSANVYNRFQTYRTTIGGGFQ